VAGLAWGIDTIVHKTALKYKTKTLAVLGSGLNIVYPPINKKLSEAIIKNGTLISEYPLDTPAKKYHFPLRNRIISGLCQGVVVVEAPLKSGALITAKYALEQNREVFSVPGPIFSNVSIGTNRLIQEGAKLILSARDIFDELNITSPDTKEKIETLENKTEEVIMSFFKNDEPVLIDKIIEESNFKTAEILAALTNLELKGLIKNIGGGYYVKAH
jgi:DNA processing protein